MYTLLYLFTYFIYILAGLLLFVAACGLSLVTGRGLLLVGASLVLEHVGSRHVGFSSYSKWTQWLCFIGLVAPRHVELPRTRD